MRSARHLIWLLIAWGWGCSSGQDTPEKALSRYLELSFNMEEVSGKRQLLLVTAGNLHDAISRATDETIREAFVVHRYRMLGYSVIERRQISPRKFDVKFVLHYLERREGAKSFEGTPTIFVENTVRLVKEQRVWKVSDVLASDATFDFPLVPSATIGPSR